MTYELLNGDSISGEFLEDESTDETKVILQPQLGRIEIKVSSIKPPPRKPLWKSNLEAGVNGSSTGDDKSFGASVSATTKYVPAGRFSTMSSSCARSIQPVATPPEVVGFASKWMSMSTPEPSVRAARKVPE